MESLQTGNRRREGSFWRDSHLTKKVALFQSLESKLIKLSDLRITLPITNRDCQHRKVIPQAANTFFGYPMQSLQALRPANFIRVDEIYLKIYLEGLLLIRSDRCSTDALQALSRFSPLSPHSPERSPSVYPPLKPGSRENLNFSFGMLIAKKFRSFTLLIRWPESGSSLKNPPELAYGVRPERTMRGTLSDPSVCEDRTQWTQRF